MHMLKFMLPIFSQNKTILITGYANKHKFKYL